MEWLQYLTGDLVIYSLITLATSILGYAVITSLTLKHTRQRNYKIS